MSLSLNGRHLKPKIPLCPPPPPLQLSRFQYTAKNENSGILHCKLQESTYVLLMKV